MVAFLLLSPIYSPTYAIPCFIFQPMILIYGPPRLAPELQTAD